MLVRAKVADKPEPKGIAVGYSPEEWEYMDVRLSAERRNLTCTVDYAKRGKPILSPGNRKANRKERR